MANAVSLPGKRLAGLSADLFHKLQAGSRTLDELENFLQGKNCFAVRDSSYGSIDSIVVDYDISIYDQFKTDGIYDENSREEICRYFSCVGKGKQQFSACLFQFATGVDKSIARWEIERAGWTVAKIEHLLALRKAKKKMYVRYCPGRIVAIGSCGTDDNGRTIFPEMEQGDPRYGFIVSTKLELQGFHHLTGFLAVQPCTL